jgi:hypothetical protein
MQVSVKWRETGSDEAEKLWTDANARVFADSGWTLPRSITGYSIDAYGLLVDSRAVLQETTADSSTFAEIIACHRGTKEGVWTRRAILEIIAGVEYNALLKSNGKKLTIPIFGDNVGALKFAREANVSNKMKHVNSRRLSLLERAGAGWRSELPPSGEQRQRRRFLDEGIDSH